jgi:hypothetical protein
MTLVLDGLPTDILVRHPRSTERTYQFQIIDPATGVALDLTTVAALVTDIKVMLKISRDDDDGDAIVTKSLLTSGVLRSIGPDSVLAVNGWFDVTFLYSDIQDPDVFPDGARFAIGAKIYPQHQEVMDGVFEIHGETVRG